MPSYEAALLIKKLSKPETGVVLKRIATQILNNDGILFGISNLGTRALPFKISAHGNVHKEGSHYIMQFDSSSAALEKLEDEHKRDVDIIRSLFSKITKEPGYNCTLEKDLQPAAYRENVQELIKQGRKAEKRYNLNTGLNYNPFKRV